MTSLSFEIIDATTRDRALAPTLSFRLRIGERSFRRVHALLLRCQIQIEPRRRRYSPDEQHKLYELFGEPERWRETLHPLFWMQPVLLVPGFEGMVEIDLPAPCTYDFDVAATKYFHALDDGVVPLLFLFSGTLFLAGGSGFNVEHVPWDREASFQLPVRTWRAAMDACFPNSAWIRLRRDTFDALHEFRARQALPTWEATIGTLLESTKVETVP